MYIAPFPAPPRYLIRSGLNEFVDELPIQLQEVDLVA